MDNGDTKAAGLAHRGWDSTFSKFGDCRSSQIVDALRRFVKDDLGSDVSQGQDQAWSDSVGRLQDEINHVRNLKVQSHSYGVILEYQLPMELRRPDSVLLLDKSVAVLEFKGNPRPGGGAVDQVHAYARDLKLYHRECHDRDVRPVLVDMQRKGQDIQQERGVHICGPDMLDDLILEIDDKASGVPLDRRRFLSEDAYCPLPSLITAARELFESKKMIRRIWRASANTDKTVERLLAIVEEAKGANGKHLALVTGVPGAGKTLVGLRLVHDKSLDTAKDPDSAIASIFLSGNGPLVGVLQHELAQAGGDGKTFVRDLKSYVKSHANNSRKPNEHVIVYDEAQRAWDRDAVAAGHKGSGFEENPKTEPDMLVEFADRKDSWTVIVGLIGTGQHIQVGEESGLSLWADAVGKSGNDWQVHAPEEVGEHFADAKAGFRPEKDLRLGKSVRSHLSEVLHEYVDLLLEPTDDNGKLQKLAEKISKGGFDFRITRDADKCRKYLRERYEDNPDARYGKIVSGRAKGMDGFGFDNTWNAMTAMKRNPGPWFGQGLDKEGSCCNLCSCATEFEIQGLELDATWLAWGSDLVLPSGKAGWDHSRMQQYNAQNKRRIKDPLGIRVNAYRVLLTRARDACLVYVPRIEENGEDILQRTYDFLLGSGMRPLR